MLSDSKIYQFNISLKGPKPKIWRRIQVLEDSTFWDMHVAIQNIMPWEDYHLHQFEVVNPGSGRMDFIGKVDDMMGITINEREAKLKDYFIHPRDKGTYLYDFGCDWFHDIIFEKSLPAVAGVQYPRCTAGKNPCLLEDGNGVRPEKDFDYRQVKFNNPEEYWDTWFGNPNPRFSK